MTKELRETLELVRTCHRVVTINRQNKSTPPVIAACDRIDQALVTTLECAVETLASEYPSADPREIAFIKQAIKSGKIPEEYRSVAA